MGSPELTRGRAEGLVEVVRAAARLVLMTLACTVLASVVPVLFGWRSYVILSGSMTPGVRAGDVVVAAPVRPADLMPGRIVVFPDPGRPARLVVHRITSVGADGALVTKGDANAVADSTPVAAGDVRGVARLRLPMIALPAYWWQAGAWLPMAGGVGGVVALLMVGYPPARSAGHAARHRRRG